MNEIWCAMKFGWVIFCRTPQRYPWMDLWVDGYPIARVSLSTEVPSQEIGRRIKQLIKQVDPSYEIKCLLSD